MTTFAVLCALLIGLQAGALYLIRSLFLAWRETVVELTERAAAERAELEDRLMAILKPEGASLKKALDEDEPNEVAYVDEEREAQLQFGGSNGATEEEA